MLYGALNTFSVCKAFFFKITCFENLVTTNKYKQTTTTMKPEQTCVKENRLPRRYWRGAFILEILIQLLDAFCNVCPGSLPLC